jgi:hypothetical protein
MASDAGDEPASSGGPAAFRRLDEAQYKYSIEDIFGPGIKIPGRFEPPLRAEGLLAIGDSSVVVTPSGFEQYEFKAREIAVQVMAQDRRKAMVPCEPQSASAIDNACSRKFLGTYGRLLFRRPLSAQEMNSTLKVTQLATQKTGDFYQGLEFALARLLMSPNFLFRVDATEAGSGRMAVQHLSAYSLASRISFLLWDAPPDGELLDAAASGELKQQKGLAHQVDRLIASPRF